MAILFAATYPDRTWALLLGGAPARFLWAPDYPWGYREEDYARESEEDLRRWGTREHALETARYIAPSASAEDQDALATMIRQGASPGASAALDQMNKQIDVRHALPAIRVPTLVLNRDAESEFIVRSMRYLAEHIPGARHVEAPGADHSIFAGNAGPVLDAIEEFLKDAWARWSEATEPERVLATVLFTDIVGSTATAAEVGDRRWRELLEQHHARIREQLARYRGVELDTAGDGFFARFDGPARAIRCACEIRRAVAEVGIDIRAGLHTGECELVDEKVAGIAVSIGARVAARARPGEVLVSQTVKDLVAGSGIGFEDRGAAELKGVPGEWRLYAVESV